MYLTIQQVSQFLGLHPMTVYKLAREHHLPAYKLGGKWRFSQGLIEKWLEQGMKRHTITRNSRGRKR